MKLLLISVLIARVFAVTLQSSRTFPKVSDSWLSQHHLTLTGKTDQTAQLHPDDHWVEKTSSDGPAADTRHRSVPTDHSQPLVSSNNCTLIGHFANCANLGLRDVPQDLPADILRLSLYNNSITKLKDYAFAQFALLQYLDLSSNRISSLQPYAFYNLSELTELNLYKNKLLLKLTTYPLIVFCPLKSLVSLDISFNNGNVTQAGLQYPDLALSCLKNLESLSIDGLPMNNKTTNFGEGFRKLRKLTSLTMKGYLRSYCALSGLYEHSFRNVDNLQRVILNFCNIEGRLTAPESFHRLRNLRQLDLSGNIQIGTDHLQTIFSGLSALGNLIELNVGSVVNRHAVGQCLDLSTFRVFPQHLTSLNASGNNLEAVDEDVIGQLPPNLTTLDLSGNRFIVGSYLRQLHKLQKLEIIRLNNYLTSSVFPNVYPYLVGDVMPASRNCTTFLKEKEKFVLTLPPNVHTIEMKEAGFNYIWTKLNVSEKNTLTTLIASGNRFPSLEGPILGLHSLKHLDLSSCYVTAIRPKFFNTLSSLEVLRLDSNALGSFLSDNHNEDVFSALTNLRSLNLTSNTIRFLPQGLFKTLSNLTSLYLGDNFLVSFDVDLRAIVSLSFLDLSHTYLSTLPRQTQTYFDNLVTKAGFEVSISMNYTPISCKCENHEFLQWITKSKAFSRPFHNYYCDIVYSGHPPVTDDYERILEALRKQCASNGLLLFFVVSTTLAVCFFIIGAIIYRYRWSIRYMYYAVYLRFKKISNLSENAHEFDAFICYASEDAHFAEGTLDRELSGRGLKIFLHGRDFKAGDYVSSNIVNAVCCSRKTVVLLTEALLDSYWCGYEIEMAKMEGIHSGRPVLIFVFVEDIPQRKLSTNLLYNIKNNTYVEYMTSPSDPDQMSKWWDKLASDIQE